MSDFDAAALLKRRSAMVREMRESYAALQARPEDWADYVREARDREWDESDLSEIPD